MKKENKSWKMCMLCVKDANKECRQNHPDWVMTINSDDLRLEGDK